MKCLFDVARTGTIVPETLTAAPARKASRAMMYRSPARTEREINNEIYRAEKIPSPASPRPRPRRRIKSEISCRRARCRLCHLFLTIMKRDIVMKRHDKCRASAATVPLDVRHRLTIFNGTRNYALAALTKMRDIEAINLRAAHARQCLSCVVPSYWRPAIAARASRDGTWHRVANGRREG